MALNLMGHNTLRMYFREPIREPWFVPGWLVADLHNIMPK